MTKSLDQISQQTLKESKRLPMVDLLRGLAAFSVCMFHFTNGNPNFLSSGWLWYIHQYGWLGVDVFFVISGFIIPYTLFQSHYQAKDYLRFLWKRWLRLSPPYWISLALIMGLNGVRSCFFNQVGVQEISWLQILRHFFYINQFSDTEWLNPVFWTLAIEAQYYLVIGIIFPFLIRRGMRSIILVIVGIGVGVAFLSTTQWVFNPHYCYLFSLGYLVFAFKVHFMTQRTFLLGVLILTSIFGRSIGICVSVVGLTTAYFLSFAKFRVSPFFLFLGDISYSLYLIHVPVGGKLINLGVKFGGGIGTKILFILLAVMTSVVVAWILYRWVEKPSQNHSSAVRYQSS